MKLNLSTFNASLAELASTSANTTPTAQEVAEAWRSNLTYPMSDTMLTEKLLNTSAYIDDSPDVLPCPSALLAGYCVALVFSNLLLNLALLVALILQQRRVTRPSDLMILNLCVADLAVGLIHLPALLVSLSNATLPCELICAVLPVLERGSIAATIWASTLISADRYLFIAKSDTYGSKVTRRRCIAAVLFVWSMAVTFAVSAYFTSSYRRTRSGHCLCYLTLDFFGFFHLIYSAGYISLCFVLPTTLLFIFYGFVIRVAQLRRSSGEKNPFRDDGDGLKVHEVKAARVLFVLVSLYLVFVTPYFVTNLAISTGHWPIHTLPYSVYISTVLLLHTLSSLNPLFYGFSRSHVRYTLLNIFASRRVVQSTCEESATTDFESSATDVSTSRSSRSQPDTAGLLALYAEPRSSPLCRRCHGFVMPRVDSSSPVPLQQPLLPLQMRFRARVVAADDEVNALVEGDTAVCEAEGNL